jgi:hypothetical protein
MMLSPSDPSILMGKAFGEMIRPLRDITPLSEVPTGPFAASLLLFIEESIASGITVLDADIRFDLNWRTTVFRGLIAHDEATERLILDNIKDWIGFSEALIETVVSLENHGLKVPSAELLRARIVEARAMVRPDDEFFEGKALDHLTTEAVAEHDRGETVEFTEMGQ